MYLKSLELNGFKSFAKKGTLEFSTPITAIVGPNGSGKSNVAEAFRFVLGEQSIKSLRGKKGEDLIFNGGSDAPRANRAAVKVVFDNSKRFLNIDFDEVSIERVVHRDGINEYFINGSSVRLKDIVELLAQAHIGSTGHHIISQGEADRVLNANPKERKSMIEDALGLKVYQYKRKESEKKLQKTHENIREVELLRKEIAPHLRFLKKQVEKIEKARSMREELKGLYREYLKREDVYLGYEREKIAGEKEGPEHRLRELEAELSSARETLSGSEGKDQKSAEVMELESKIASVRGEKDGLVRELGRLEGEIHSHRRMIQKQHEAAESDARRVVPWSEAEHLARGIKESVEEAERSEDIGFIKSALARVRETLRGFLEGNVAKADTSLIAEYEKEIAGLEEKRAGLESRLGEIEGEEKSLSESHVRLQREIEKEKDVNRDAEKAVFRIMAEQNELRSKLGILRDREERLAVLEESFRRELEEGSMLVGPEILQYKNFEISPQAVAEEDRKVQAERQRAIEKIKIRLEDMGGGTGDDIVKEFEETSERDQYLFRELEDLEKSAEVLRGLIADLEERLNVEFKEGIQSINSQFQEFFAVMFGGGTAGLSVVKEEKRRRSDTDVSIMSDEEVREEEDEDTEEGIEINVTLPRKKIKGLMMLSGGERALTSIALLFAMSQVNPPPFIILDETDAALDEANSKKYGDMIRTLSKESQLILITHNRETMSRAGVLYGVTMGASGISKLLSIAFEEAEAIAK